MNEALEFEDVALPFLLLGFGLGIAAGMLISEVFSVRYIAELPAPPSSIDQRREASRFRIRDLQTRVRTLEALVLKSPTPAQG